MPTVQSNFKTTLSASLGNAAGDLQIFLDTVPENSTGYLVLDAAGSNYELVYYESKDSTSVTCSASNGRGLSLTATTRTGIAANRSNHGAGVSCIQAPDHYLLNDKSSLSEGGIFTGDFTFSGDVIFSGSQRVPVYADATARDAAITSPVNGQEAYLTDTSKFTDYQGGAWANRETGGTFSNASTTVAGKVEIATGAELAAGTGTGGTGAVLAIAPDNTSIINTSAGAGDAGKLIKLDASGEVAENMLPLAISVAELDQLNGISANVTDTNLNTVTAGAASNADALHSHQNPAKSYTAGETISTDDAVGLVPVEVEWFDQLTEADIALGDSNVRRRYSVKFTPTRTPNFTTKKFRFKDSTGSSTMTLTCTIETDNAGEPSGTPVTNGTSNTVDTSTFTTAYGDKTFTWSSAPVMVSGTVYHWVMTADKTDVTDYVIMGVNSSYDENYLTFTRQTYDLDAGTWGNSVTNATPFFWTLSEAKSLGMALVPTDANFGGRTWNFEGIAKAGGSAGDSIDVYYDIVPGLSGLVPGEDYYISTSAGLISSTIPSWRNGQNFAYKIGKAISTTELRVSPGSKEVWGTSTASASATTIHQFVTWFKMKSFETSGSYLSDTNILHVTESGMFDGAVNYSVSSEINTAAAPSAATSTSVSYGGASHGGKYWGGVGSDITDAGLTYTVTKTSTPGDYQLIWKAKA